MRRRLPLLLLAPFLILLGASAARAAGPATANRAHLKPGAEGTLCLGCHQQLQETMRLPFVHTPVKNGDCSDCHDPHAASHGKLLAADPDRICMTCHTAILPPGAKSEHPDAASGKCTRCHDPHGSANKNLLLAAGNALCFTCHKELGEKTAGAPHKHPPVAQSCLTCHAAHASVDADFLLAKRSPTLCTGCHKADQPVFRKAHMGYPVGSSDCSSCHDPHGSSRPAILWASVHPPVADRNCAQCHDEPGSPNALKVRKQGIDSCRGCHSEMIRTTFEFNRIHWPIADRKACLNCHRPHASKAGKLLADPEIKLCARCHAGIVQQARTSPAQHKPVAEGACSLCHAPHGSNSVLLLTAADSTALCETCHSWEKHSSHPIGPDVADPRNRNTRVDCLSCHDTHGSPHKYLTWLDKKMDLCVACHQDFRR